MTHEFSLAYAQRLDQADSLASFRDRFFIPQVNGQEAIYLCGNSLGLQPKSVKEHLQVELNDWAGFGVEGHVHGKNPWLYYHHFTQDSLSRIVGANKKEVVAMGSLTANLHFLMVSFYQPKGKRTKILIENRPFPSDRYAIESQVRWHGLDPQQEIIEMKSREGEAYLRTEDILATIEQYKDELALVMFGGVHFYTGQLFDMARITAAAHAVGAYAGFDLAHATGNVELKLHDWNVDFACWCTYKYLNSGPGGVGGIFVHEQHHQNDALPRLHGWWGHDEANRFKMEDRFVSMGTAESWQLSNAPVVALAVHKAAVELFDEAGMDRIYEKGKQLSNYFLFCMQTLQTAGVPFDILTPTAENERGCQLSLSFHSHGRGIFDQLTRDGVIADWREPGVIRMAPVPMYNRFEDIYRVAELIKSSFENNR